MVQLLKYPLRILEMAPPVGSLPGIGSKTAGWLSEIGVRTEADLRALGAVNAYIRLKRAYPQRVTLNALWALHGALTGTPWHAIPPDEKHRLLNAVRCAPD